MHIDKMRYRLGGIALAVFVIWFMPSGIFSQELQDDTTNMIKYTPEFKFREGIFLNSQQVRKNAPIPKSRIITTWIMMTGSIIPKYLVKRMCCSTTTSE